MQATAGRDKQTVQDQELLLRKTALSPACRCPRLVVAGRLGTAGRWPASSRTAGRRAACRSCSAHAAFPIRAACSSARSAGRRRRDAASHATLAVSGSPPHSRYRSPNAARNAASDRSCRRWCGNSGCPARLGRPARRTAGSTIACRRVWPFHHVNILSRNCFISARPFRESFGSDATGQPKCPVRRNRQWSPGLAADQATDPGEGGDELSRSGLIRLFPAHFRPASTNRRKLGLRIWNWLPRNDWS